MCYSAESSLRTSLISFIAIIYLLSSNIPYYNWIGITLIGWCIMQFVEFLLWTTNPREECTELNKQISQYIIPVVLMMQPILCLWGSLYVISWKNSNELRKKFKLFYTTFIIILVYFFEIHDSDKKCTYVTKEGHLYWLRFNMSKSSSRILIYLWFLSILAPLLIFWSKNYILLILLISIPLIAFCISFYTDSQGSIWCYYTSYTSIIASIALFMHQTNIYKLL